MIHRFFSLLTVIIACITHTAVGYPRHYPKPEWVRYEFGHVYSQQLASKLPNHPALQTAFESPTAINIIHVPTSFRYPAYITSGDSAFTLKLPRSNYKKLVRAIDDLDEQQQTALAHNLPYSKPHFTRSAPCSPVTKPSHS